MFGFITILLKRKNLFFVILKNPYQINKDLIRVKKQKKYFYSTTIASNAATVALSKMGASSLVVDTPVNV